jgi:hypothetical protein
MAGGQHKVYRVKERYRGRERHIQATRRKAKASYGEYQASPDRWFYIAISRA